MRIKIPPPNRRRVPHRLSAYEINYRPSCSLSLSLHRANLNPRTGRHRKESRINRSNYTPLSPSGGGPLKILTSHLPRHKIFTSSIFYTSTIDLARNQYAKEKNIPPARRLILFARAKLTPAICHPYIHIYLYTYTYTLGTRDAGRAKAAAVAAQDRAPAAAHVAAAALSLFPSGAADLRRASGRLPQSCGPIVPRRTGVCLCVCVYISAGVETAPRDVRSSDESVCDGVVFRRQISEVRERLG